MWICDALDEFLTISCKKVKLFSIVLGEIMVFWNSSKLGVYENADFFIQKIKM